MSPSGPVPQDRTARRLRAVVNAEYCAHHLASARLFFSPFVKFVEFVAIKIKIASISVCSQASGHVTLMSEVHRSRRATHPSHDGPIVRNPGRWGFSIMEWKDHVMGSKSEVSPPRSAVREFFSSLAGMITIGLAAGLVLCSPFFIYWQRSSPETRAVSPRAAPPQPPTPPAQVPIKTESKQQTTSIDQFLPTPEQSTTTHNTESANDLAVSSNLSEREQIDLALKFRLLGRPAEQEKVLRNPQSPEAKVMRALMIQEDSAELRGSGMTTFDRSEAEKLATEALPNLSADAESKPLSMYLLSNLYTSGLGVPKDLHQAFRLSSEAASYGEKAAYRGLSWAYFLGVGVEKDEAKSLEWARRAADAGDTVMMLRVSNGYEEGRVLKRSLAAWMYYLEKAARAGNPEAMRRYSEQVNNIPIYMYMGDTLNSRKSRIEESVDWLVKSAEAGNQIAMNVLSYEYEGRMGSRVRPDRKKAFEWSKKAAASGLPFAIACLSRLYRFGIGCKQNEEEADSLLEQAKRAAKGDEKMISSVEMQSRSSPFAATDSAPQSESSEPVADQSAREATPKPDRSPRPTEAKSPAKPEGQRLTIAILEQTGKHIKFGGMIPSYEVIAMVRNTSSVPLKLLTMTVIFRRADNTMIGTEARMADARTLEPGDTTTVKVMDNGENLAEIDHYDLKFTAGSPDEKNVDFTVEQPERSAPRSKVPARRRRP